MNYDLAKPSDESAKQQDLPPSLVCTPVDLPPAVDGEYLPSTIECQAGEILRRRRVPAAMRWSPRTHYADILLFTVIFLPQDQHAIYFFLQAWRDEDSELQKYANSEDAARAFAAEVDSSSGSNQSRIAAVKWALKEETRRLARLSSL